MINWNTIAEGNYLCDTEGVNYFEVVLVVWTYDDNDVEVPEVILVRHHEFGEMNATPSQLEGIGIDMIA